MTLGELRTCFRVREQRSARETKAVRSVTQSLRIGVESRLTTPANSVHMNRAPCGIAADAIQLKQPPTRMLIAQQCRLRGKCAESSHQDLCRMNVSIRYRVISVLLKILEILVSGRRLLLKLTDLLPKDLYASAKRCPKTTSEQVISALPMVAQNNLFFFYAAGYKAAAHRRFPTKSGK